METKREMLLAALSAAKGVPFSPLQVQKYIFLLDKNAGDEIGHLFHFIPYHYGPFDVTIYNVLDELAKDGLIEISSGPEGRWRQYRVTPKGQLAGDKLLVGLPAKVAPYLSKLSEYVRSLSFAELVSTIYKLYPEMMADSV